VKGRRIFFFLSFYLLLFASYLSSAAETRDDRFALGVMRRDGVVVPFAAFDGKRWSSPWPAPQFQLEIPINLMSVPKGWWGATGPLSEWQVWPAVGAAAPRTVRTTQPDWVAAHCVRQIALDTDYKSDRPVPPLSEQPYPKDGLAVAPPQALERIEVIPAGGAAAETLAGGLRAKFNESELEVDHRFGHPTPRRTREAQQPIIEALYAFGEKPRAFYIEASRTYRSLGQDDCRIAFATGWFLRTGPAAAEVKWVDMAVDLLPCNKYGATYMLPFGALRVGRRTFWIAQYAGWDYERYVVVELKKNGVEAVVSKWGGGC
jgi:hypothetical protein